MKLNFQYYLSFLFLIGMLFTACHSHPKAEKGDYAYTAAYVCPMHCAGSGSDQPGKCPVCKMNYKENKDYKAEKQNPDEVRQEPEDAQHPEKEGDHEEHNH